ncbi:MAG: hypothetical protein ABIV47_16205 [Roseiflexaceae bacterium]
MKTLNEIRAELNQLLFKLGISKTGLPDFGTIQNSYPSGVPDCGPSTDGYPNYEVDARGYHYVEVERDMELRRDECLNGGTAHLAFRLVC